MHPTLQKPEAMLFDLDGTLFQTETLLLPAYHATFDQLRAEGSYTGETPPESEILGGLGMLLEHIWQRVMPGVDEQVHRRADVLLLDHQVQGLERGEGRMYDEVEATLKALRDRGIRLFVASNGLEPYVKGVIEHKGLSPLFEGLYSAGEFRTRSKVDLVRMLLETYGVQSAWMVGDRSSDVEAGRENGLAVIGCDYAGFRKEGELDGADVRIGRFSELLELLPKEADKANE
ncbi:HAD-IA family hydrolase [Paenibacillus doosanensis]|uniref:Phosphoglycolate phosphatase n=1 Tax=Paenibacillus konkukensis TaxID=2020716 RepID=A0ABY4RKY7_9BACL|nr:MULTISPECIES: HAD-IA family hydrolase [Paenibacillus]MCS7463635.1 HAD-IA family hydrolase [Paenibacillus doosanensis]UQZ83161.1 Phosphoglycolate phosphatase [Paenibacillus konkukensis]